MCSASVLETGRVSNAAAAFLRPLRGRLIGRDELGARGVPKGTSAPVLQRPHGFHFMLMREDERQQAETGNKENSGSKSV